MGGVGGGLGTGAGRLKLATGYILNCVWSARELRQGLGSAGGGLAGLGGGERGVGQEHGVGVQAREWEELRRERCVLWSFFFGFSCFCCGLFCRRKALVELIQKVGTKMASVVSVGSSLPH